MARGAEKGSRHFEDWEMNPGTGKGKHADPPKKEHVEKRADAIGRNVQGKGTPTRDDK